MEHDLTRTALDAIAFATGAALSAMLGGMQLRVDRTENRISGYLLLWVLGFIWTSGNLLRGVLELTGAAADSTGARFAETFAWSCTLIGPVAVGRLLQGSIGATSRISRAFFASTVGVSLLNLGLLVRANHVYDWRLEASGYPTMSFFIALVLGAVALLLYVAHRRRSSPSSRRTMPRWFAPAALLFAAIHTTAILLSLWIPDMPESLLTLTTLIGRHWTIPWAVLIAVSLAQTHNADVVLKRSLWLLISATLATAVATQVLGAAPGLPLLTTALAAAALMLVTPGLIRALDTLVDRTVLDRPDYAEANQLLDRALRKGTEPGTLIEAALTSLGDTLRVDARWIDGDADTAPAPLASVAVRRPGLPAARIGITATHQARTLMQPEIAFLESVGAQLEHRLEALHFEAEQRTLHLREERLKRLLTEAELKALRTQVDPHFLFNTLNTIADLISHNPQQAERMTERLAECFRYALAKHSRDLSTLDEELDFARQYLEIEQVRFGDRLRVMLSRGNASGNEAIPSLLLQPLLENAIRHGLAPVREGGCVSVRAQRDGERLRLNIEDDGVGLRAGSSAGVGLHNVQERLRALYAQAAEFVIGDRAGGGRGTSVTIVIPLHGQPLHDH